LRNYKKIKRSLCKKFSKLLSKTPKRKKSKIKRRKLLYRSNLGKKRRKKNIKKSNKKLNKLKSKSNLKTRPKRRSRKKKPKKKLLPKSNLKNKRLKMRKPRL
jgi:hypothetical protein